MTASRAGAKRKQTSRGYVVVAGEMYERKDPLLVVVGRDAQARANEFANALRKCKTAKQAKALARKWGVDPADLEYFNFDWEVHVWKLPVVRFFVRAGRGAGTPPKAAPLSGTRAGR